MIENIGKRVSNEHRTGADEIKNSENNRKSEDRDKSSEINNIEIK